MGLAGLAGLPGISGIVPGVAAPGGFTCSDPDGAAFIAAVEAADGQALEDGVKQAYCEFFTGCKSDASPFAGVSNWQAMHGCLLMGARTLAGALVPFRGAAPSPIAFDAADYNRVSGLKGDGVGKMLNTNRDPSLDAQGNTSMAVGVSEYGTIAVGRYLCGGDSYRTLLFNAASSSRARLNSGTINVFGATASAGLLGVSRSNVNNYQAIRAGATFSISQLSAPTVTGLGASYTVFRTAIVEANFSDGRLYFYTTGPAVNLPALNSRLSTLVAAISTALV